MPFETRYYFVASMDVTPEKVDLFNEVYDTEHVPSLMTVPGVISVSRSQKVEGTLRIGGSSVPVGDGEPQFQAIYEIEHPDVLRSDAWAAASEAGRWAEEVRPFTSNRHHVIRQVILPVV